MVYGELSESARLCNEEQAMNAPEGIVVRVYPEDGGFWVEAWASGHRAARWRYFLASQLKSIIEEAQEFLLKNYGSEGRLDVTKWAAAIFPKRQS